MSDIHFRNLIDPPAVERLAGIVDPEIAARHTLASQLIAASNEIYKRTRAAANQRADAMFIASAQVKKDLEVLAKQVGYESER